MEIAEHSRAQQKCSLSMAIGVDICYSHRPRRLHGQESTFQQSGQGLSTRSCILLARAVRDPTHFAQLSAAVSKYLKVVVGGIDMLIVYRPWPSVCGCRAKTLELAQTQLICALRPSGAIYMPPENVTETAVSSF